MAREQASNLGANCQSHDAWLRSHYEAVVKERAGLVAVERLWSWARLATFAAAAVAWYPLRGEPTLSLITTIGLVGVFALAVRRHLAVRDRRELTDRLLVIVSESLRRCGGRVALIRSWVRPVDPTDQQVDLEPVQPDGPTWTLTEQEQDDLDVYTEPVGLYGLLNRTSTSLGARRLRDMIEQPCLSVEHIEARQSVVRRLEENPAPRLRVMAATAILREQDAWLERLAAAIHGAVPFPWQNTSLLLRLWSILSAAVTLTAIVQAGRGVYGWAYPAVLVLLLNTFVCMRINKTVKKSLAPWKAVARVTAGYLHAARQAATDLPDEPELRPLRERFRAVVVRNVLPALCTRVAWAESGGMLHAMCNLVFLYDLHVAQAILTRVLPYQHTLLSGLGALADLDALNSLACFAYESAGTRSVCYPSFIAETELSITAGRHPLISPDCVIPNGVHLGSRSSVWVITGPNMAGKSTLLRMCGVNALLAQIGSVAIAERMTLAPVRLITDLGVRDSLAKSESYFLAEVRHLRRMVLDDGDGAPVLGLIDEPFRGTNSEERVAASLALVEHVLASPGLFLVATHEGRIAALADRSERVENHHFREELDETGIVFDYGLRAGAAEERNALHVLQREGYPRGLLERANVWLQETDGESLFSGDNEQEK
jgi:hypothetical protein